MLVMLGFYLRGNHTPYLEHDYGASILFAFGEPTTHPDEHEITDRAISYLGFDCEDEYIETYPGMIKDMIQGIFIQDVRPKFPRKDYDWYYPNVCECCGVDEGSSFGPYGMPWHKNTLLTYIENSILTGQFYVTPTLDEVEPYLNLKSKKGDYIDPLLKTFCSDWEG